MEKIVLVGAGGHAKTIIDTIERSRKYEIIGCVDTDKVGASVYRTYKVIGTDHDLGRIFNAGVHNAFVSIGYLGYGDIRLRLYNRLKEIGYLLPVIVDNTAIVADRAFIGEGTYIGRNVVINANTKIGKMSIINTSAVIEHDGIIGDFSHVAVAATVCGSVNIGEQCMIGANATIIQGINIGSYSIVGAGALVVKDVSSCCVVKSKLICEYNMKDDREIK